MKVSQTTHYLFNACKEAGMKVQVLGESILIHPNGGEAELHEITARVGVKAHLQDDGKYLIKVSPSFHPLAHIVRFMDDPDAGFFNLSVGEKAVSFLFDDGNSQVDYELPIETVASAAQDCGVLTDYDHNEVWEPGAVNPQYINEWAKYWAEERKASTDLYDVMRAAMRIEWTEHITRIGSELHRFYYAQEMEKSIDDPTFHNVVREMYSIIETINQ